jgi:hypothetical protein
MPIQTSNRNEREAFRVLVAGTFALSVTLSRIFVELALSQLSSRRLILLGPAALNECVMCDLNFVRRHAFDDCVDDSKSILRDERPTPSIKQKIMVGSQRAVSEVAFRRGKIYLTLE